MARYHCSVVGRIPSKTEGVRLNSRTVSRGPRTTPRKSAHTMTLQTDLLTLPQKSVQASFASSGAGPGAGTGAAAAGAGAGAGALRGLAAAGAGVGALGIRLHLVVGERGLERLPRRPIVVHQARRRHVEPAFRLGQIGRAHV